ncbi:hypothetical protein BDU57DRAFT_28084 [Ampelomyces quisqualis]|uniref:Uncharacterized protein n=1 Tax=Ampelomyces quisqualis TaxID=50730 RepID=A0A6A5R4J1_AMPQU|nr:hypothetical protein BDU57DRAFT_28084 [Ampelomyces quisqualis]
MTFVLHSGNGAALTLSTGFFLLLLAVRIDYGDFVPRNSFVQNSDVVAILYSDVASYYPDSYYPEYWGHLKIFFRPAWEGGQMKERAVDRTQ